MGNTVTVPGANSTVSVPPAGSPAASSSWSVEYNLDFTAQSAHTFVDGAAHSMGGVNWESQNAAYADSGYPAVGGSGLVVPLSSAAATNRWFSYIQTGPALVALLSDVVPGYGPSDTVVIQCLLNFNLTTAGTGSTVLLGGLLCSDGNFGSSGGGIWNYGGTYSNTATSYDISRFGGGPGSGMGNPYFSASAGSGTSRSVFCEIVLFPGSGWTATTVNGSAFQDPLTVGGSVSHGNMQVTETGLIANNPSIAGPDFNLTPANRRVGLMAYYQTISGARDAAATFTITKFRALKRV